METEETTPPAEPPKEEQAPEEKPTEVKNPTLVIDAFGTYKWTREGKTYYGAEVIMAMEEQDSLRDGDTVKVTLKDGDTVLSTSTLNSSITTVAEIKEKFDDACSVTGVTCDHVNTHGSTLFTPKKEYPSRSWTTTKWNNTTKPTSVTAEIIRAGQPISTVTKTGFSENLTDASCPTAVPWNEIVAWSTSPDWNTGTANEYGEVSFANGDVTLKATSNADGTLYYAPYTTFGRGNTDKTFDNGFETSITFDMTKVDASTSLYWEHDLNDTSAANKIGFSTILNQSSDKNSVKVDYSYNDDSDTYIYKSIDGTLDSTKPITIKTKAEPSGGKIKITITASDGTKNLTASHNVKGAASVYGGLRIGWVHFTAASKTVDASAVTYRDLDAPTPPTPPATPSYGGGGGSYTPSDTTADVSANTPEGTEATVDSSVTNIANPVLDVKAAAANAPEVAEFIKATTGFAVAKVFQINMFDSTTIVKQVEGGKVEITLPFTAPDTSKQYVVLRYNDDKTVTVIPATIDGGKITFKTDHFSTYAIAVKSDNPNLFVDTTVNQPTIPSSPTTVPKTGIALLGRLF